MPYAIARNEVSNGAAGLLRLGFGLDPSATIDERLRTGFLDDYAENICRGSRFFLHPAELAAICHENGARWGIVTNKPGRLTNRLLDALQSGHAPGCVVSGDTLTERKPHPAPLLHAATQLNLAPSECVYIGDARRDIEAGHAAGMDTIAVAYGYIRLGEPIASWGANHLARSPTALTTMLRAMTQETH